MSGAFIGPLAGNHSARWAGLHENPKREEVEALEKQWESEVDVSHSHAKSPTKQADLCFHELCPAWPKFVWKLTIKPAAACCLTCLPNDLQAESWNTLEGVQCFWWLARKMERWGERVTCARSCQFAREERILQVRWWTFSRHSRCAAQSETTIDNEAHCCLCLPLTGANARLASGTYQMPTIVLTRQLDAEPLARPGCQASSPVGQSSNDCWTVRSASSQQVCLKTLAWMRSPPPL